MSYKQAKDAGLITGGSGGGDVYLAGTNAFTGTNTFNVICPQSTIAPEVASDLCNKAYVDAGGGGGDVTLAGTNAFTARNTFNTLCPQSTVVPVAVSDLCNKAYVDANSGGDVTLSGTNTFTGLNSFNTLCPRSSVVPGNDVDLCNKAYVDSIVAAAPSLEAVLTTNNSGVGKSIINLGGITGHDYDTGHFVIEDVVDGANLDLIAANVNIGKTDQSSFLRTYAPIFPGYAYGANGTVPTSALGYFSSVNLGTQVNINTNNMTNVLNMQVPYLGVYILNIQLAITNTSTTVGSNTDRIQIYIGYGASGGITNSICDTQLSNVVLGASISTGKAIKPYLSYVFVAGGVPGQYVTLSSQVTGTTTVNVAYATETKIQLTRIA